MGRAGARLACRLHGRGSPACGSSVVFRCCGSTLCAGLCAVLRCGVACCVELRLSCTFFPQLAECQSLSCGACPAHACDTPPEGPRLCCLLAETGKKEEVLRLSMGRLMQVGGDG